MKGYKILDNNFCCRGLQYAVGETQIHLGAIESCESGLHFCERALDCLLYYSLTQDNRYAEVHAIGHVITNNDKSVTDRLTIVREIPYDEFSKLCTGTLTTQHIEKTFIEGKLEGRHRVWNDAGILQSDTMYSGDKKNGVCKRYYYYGYKRSEETFRDDVLDGYAYTWNTYGGLRSEQHFDCGVKNGVFRAWHKFGQLAYEKIYADDALNGACRAWYESGQLQSETRFVNDNLHGKKFYWWENGNRQIEDTYVNGQRHGVYRAWYEDGGLERDARYVNDKLHGTAYTYYKNGELKQETKN